MPDILLEVDKLKLIGKIAIRINLIYSHKGGAIINEKYQEM